MILERVLPSVCVCVSECVVEVETEEKVMGEVCMDLLEVGVAAEIRLSAVEALSLAKQLKMAQLEGLRKRFMLQQLQKSWMR